MCILMVHSVQKRSLNLQGRRSFKLNLNEYVSIFLVNMHLGLVFVQSHMKSFSGKHANLPGACNLLEKNCTFVKHNANANTHLRTNDNCCWHSFMQRPVHPSFGQVQTIVDG